MTPSEELVARAAAYDLLSRFFRSGLSTGLLEDMRGLPGLGSVLPASVDADSQAADHYGLLGLEVFPFASAYLEADGKLGGVTTDFVTRLMLRTGGAASGSDAPDHLSVELEHLAGLCRMQAAVDVESRAAASVAQALRELIDHLFWWLPAFHFALAGEGNAVYTQMSRWVLELLVDHRRRLPPDEGSPSYHPLPESPRILNRDSTGLRQLATYLSSPALAGIVLTRSRIALLARDLGVPRGFGDRARMLGNLLGAAGTYGVAERLVDGLGAIASDWKTGFSGLGGGEEPASLRVAAKSWREKADQSLNMLEEMARHLRAEDSNF